MRFIKELIRGGLSNLGLKVSRIKKEPWGVDLFNDVSRLTSLNDIKVVFDVGANVGQSRNLYLKKFSSSKIFSFEPVISTFKILEETNPNTNKSFCYNLALGETTEKIKIPLQEKSTQNSLSKKRNENSNPIYNLEEIKVDSLDNIVQKLDIDYIHFLKIDTEGFEMEVLKGASNYLKSKKVRFILLELGIKSHPRTTFYNSIQEYLSQLGYDVVGFYKQSQSLYTKGRFLMHCDVLFINSEWSKTLRPKFVKSFEYE